jgi:hypothetical protein
MRPLQSRFPQPLSRQWTWEHPNGSRAQLDHILICGKWLNSARNCRAYNTVEVDSDHRILTARFKLSLRTSGGKKCRRARFNWRSLQDPTIQHEFNITLKNRFEALTDSMEEDDIQAKYDHLVNAVNMTAEQTLGKKKPSTFPSWVSQKTEVLKRDRDTAKARYQLSRSPASKKRWRDLANQLTASYQADEINHLEKQMKELAEADGRGESNRVWDIINNIAGKKSTKSTKVKRRDGGQIENTDELLSEWKHYFSDLLNAGVSTSATPPDPAVFDLPIPTDQFSFEETCEAIESLNLGKAPGCDSSITAEALKNGGPFIREMTHKICNLVFTKTVAPKQWNTNIIIPLPKKGDLSSMNNYRGISLMSIAAKVYNRILLNRIRPVVDPILRQNQAGFRKGRGCTDQIHILRRVMEGARNQQIPLFVTFIDFRKAFDSIDREMMFAILRHYGIPDKIVKAIRVLYDNSKSSVFVDGLLTEEFDVTTGVLQGDVLAPFLFIIIIDFLLKRAEEGHGFTTHPRRSRREPAKVLNDLDFADDIALLSGSKEEAQQQVEVHSAAAREVGLLINIGKTEVMTPQSCGDGLILDGEEIKRVEDFRYLGSMMASSESDIKRRRALAWTAFWKLDKIWKSSHIPTQLKVGIFKTSCLSVLLYGCETWILTKKLEDYINSFATNCYRIILGIHRKDRVSNTTLYQTVNQHPLSLTIHQKQLRWIGHILRKPSNELINTYAFYDPQHGKRRQGRQKILYHQYIASVINTTITLSPAEIRRMAQDRCQWRKLVADCFAAD